MGISVKFLFYFLKIFWGGWEILWFGYEISFLEF
jgi:hypothetical protein